MYDEFFLLGLRLARKRAEESRRRTFRNAQDCARELPEKPTCRCGRYFLEAARVTAWTLNQLSSAPEAHERIESLGRVTPSELERWAQGTQSMCTNSTCPAFPVDRHGSPSLSVELEQQQPIKNGGRQAPTAASKRLAGASHDEA
jgi:hypothetical protein